MGLVKVAQTAISGTVADQWPEFHTAPAFDEKLLIAPGVLQSNRATHGKSSNVMADGSRIAVPETTAAIVTDGGGIASVTAEPGYFVYRNDGVPSMFSGSGAQKALLAQAWQRFKFGGQPAQQQRLFYVNMREVRSLRFGTPGLLAYRDHSLAAPGSSQAPVLRLRARGQYSVRVVDPITFFKTFLPANRGWYSLADNASVDQLRQEFLTSFQAALQALSRTTDIASLASHGPELASMLTNNAGPHGSWIERFGIEIVSAAISAIEYDAESREMMNKYNQGVMLGGAVGNAYTQTTMADAAQTMAENGSSGSDMVGFAIGAGAMNGLVSGLTQPVAPPATPTSSGQPITPPPPPPVAAQSDPVAVLAQLKAMLDQGLISSDQYAAKQKEVLDRM